MSSIDSIFSIVILHICMSLFESTLLSFCKTQSKLHLPTLRQGSTERILKKIYKFYIQLSLLFFTYLHLLPYLNKKIYKIYIYKDIQQDWPA